MGNNKKCFLSGKSAY